MTHGNQQFQPQCLYDPNKGETVGHDAQCLGHSAKGYFMPCCYIDGYYWSNTRGGLPEYRSHKKLNKLWDESLKISNNEHQVQYGQALQQNQNQQAAQSHTLQAQQAQALQQTQNQQIQAQVPKAQNPQQNWSFC